MPRVLIALFLLAAMTAAQGTGPRFPPIAGTNVGFSPLAIVEVIQHAGQPALLLVIPGDQPIATMYDPALLPAGTTAFALDIVAFAVLEPNACAVGAGMFLDTYGPQATFPIATVGSVGLTAHIPDPAYPMRFVGSFYSTWLLSYCTVFDCTSPCGPSDRDPDYEAFLLIPRII